MEKNRTPASAFIFYIIGIILLIVSLFMLWTAVNYTKTYLQSYDATFADMWTNTVQYVIAQFVPYLGMGVICLGLGRAISGSAAAKAAAQAKATEPELKAPAEEAPAEDAPEAAEANAAATLPEDTSEMFADLARRIDTNREVLSIKIEEKEKRDSFRIKELEKKVEGFLSDVKYINEPLEELVYKQAAGITDDEPAAEEVPAEAPAPGPVPQFFRVAKAMAMPSCPVIGAAAEAVAEAPKAGAVPQFFRVAKTMTMPACPAAAAEEAAAEAPEAGAVPPVFRVARTMTMTL